LPIREIRAGMAEVVKYGIIYDANFFDKIEEQCIGTDLLASNEILAYNISRCCEIKAEVVAKDERESGLRAILNFGHTLGHAIENVTGYTNSFIHGEAISIGMVYAAKLSVRCNGFIDHDAQRIEKLLNNIGLPTNQNGLVWNDLKEAMLVDKKTVSGIPRFVLVSNIGKVTIGHQIEERILKEVWDSLNE